jgi:hypothetical protein
MAFLPCVLLILYLATGYRLASALSLEHSIFGGLRKLANGGRGAERPPIGLFWIALICFDGLVGKNIMFVHHEDFRHCLPILFSRL